MNVLHAGILRLTAISTVTTPNVSVVPVLQSNFCLPLPNSCELWSRFISEGCCVPLRVRSVVTRWHLLCVWYVLLLTEEYLKIWLKAVPVRTWTGPLGSRRLRLPEYLDSRHIKVTELSALHTGCLYPQEISLVVISVTSWADPMAMVQPEGLSCWKEDMTNMLYLSYKYLKCWWWVAGLWIFKGTVGGLIIWDSSALFWNCWYIISKGLYVHIEAEWLSLQDHLCLKMITSLKLS
jgi:hypothetical protein